MDHQSNMLFLLFIDLIENGQCCYLCVNVWKYYLLHIRSYVPDNKFALNQIHKLALWWGGIRVGKACPLTV